MSESFPEPRGESESEQARCPSCNAIMQFDAGAGALACEFCGGEKEIEHNAKNVVELDLEAGVLAADRGLGVAETRSTKCEDCGAVVTYGGTETSTACEFCGSTQVLAQEANRNLIRPGSLLPFAITEDAAKEAFSGWIHGLWFRPTSLKKLAKVSEMRGIYVPFWTFDADVASSWTAQAGYYYYEDESYWDQDTDGNSVQKTRRVRKTRWEHASGSRHDHYDDLLVCASRGVPEKMVRRIDDFDTSKLVSYDASYLAGWRAEEYAVTLNEGFENAVDRMSTSQRNRCSRDVPGDTQRFLSVQNEFSNETFKHVLLPIWVSAYRYKNEAFQFLVNGTTGEVSGKAPWSIFKIVAAVLVVVAIAAGIYIATQR